MNTNDYISLESKFGAHNYHPLPVVIEQGDGIWVKDCDGNKFLDMLSSYSALNQGHNHPKIIKALVDQAQKLTLTSRAFYNTRLGEYLKKLCNLCDMEMALPMNTGVEAVETAIKAARKWGYTKKGIKKDQAEIIVCNNNFHGRTTTVVGFSSEEAYKEGFGPFTPGFKLVPYGNINELEKTITKNTCAFLVEPIQGEAGVIVPPEGYLKKAYDLCKKNNVLFIADEIQTGFGRSGKLFASYYESIQPDAIILGKALSGGVYPVSAVVASKEILGVFSPGTHGSTFGGSPLACAVAEAAIDVLVDEKLTENSFKMGAYFMEKLKTLKNPHIKEVRGKGLLIGLEFNTHDTSARSYCEKLKYENILCKETHDNIIRFAPPLIIEKKDIDWAFERIEKIIG